MLETRHPALEGAVVCKHDIRTGLVPCGLSLIAQLVRALH